MPINLLLANESNSLINQLLVLLEKEKNFEVIKTVNSSTELMESLQNDEIDVVIIDEELSDKSGYQAILDYMKIKPTATLIMLHGERSISRDKYIKATKYGIVEEVYLDFEQELTYLPNDFIVKLTILAKLNLERFRVQIAQLNEMDFKGTTSSIKIPEKRIIKRGSRDQVVMKLEQNPLTMPRLKRNIANIPKTKQLGTVIIIGASTGGPRTLTHLIAGLPADLPPVIVVQHLPEYFVDNFARRIDKHTNLSVVVGDTGDTIEPGHVYVAPGGYHLEFRRLEGKTRIVITDGPKINFVKPAVDVTLFSAVKHYRGNVISVILTGMGSDGTEGSRMVKSHGGHVIAQSETDSVLYGMNRSVIEAGLADHVCQIDEIANKLVEILRRG